MIEFLMRFNHFLYIFLLLGYIDSERVSHFSSSDKYFFFGRVSIEFYGRDGCQKRLRYVQFSSERYGGTLPAAPGQFVAACGESVGRRETGSEDRSGLILVFAERHRGRVESVVGPVLADAKGQRGYNAW